MEWTQDKDQSMITVWSSQSKFQLSRVFVVPNCFKGDIEVGIVVF